MTELGGGAGAGGADRRTGWASGGPSCTDPAHCITCADEGTAMRVVAVDDAGGLASCVDERGQAIEVMTGLVDAVRIGDRLLVHAATALARLPAPERAGGAG